MSFRSVLSSLAGVVPRWPSSLRWQVNGVLSVLVTLALAGGLVSVYTLRAVSASTHELAEGRLERQQRAQDLLQQARSVEQKVNRMLLADSVQELQQHYEGLNQGLRALDEQVSELASGDDDVEVLALHQASQLFRNTAHVMIGLREAELGAGAPPATVRPGAQARLRSQLLGQAEALSTAAQAMSGHVNEDYRSAVRQLAERSATSQHLVLALLAGTLALAWLVARVVLGQHVLERLNMISRYLRRPVDGTPATAVPVEGADEIGAMARSLELFLRDRAQLAQANEALQAERERQQALIQKLADTRHQLLQSEKLASIGQLAAGVAHEINNPIGFVHSNVGTMRGYVEDLMKMLAAYEALEAGLDATARAEIDAARRKLDLDYVRDDLAALIRESLDGLQRVKRIVQDLKDFSRVDSEAVEIADLERGLECTINVAWNELKSKADVVKDFGAIPEIECNPSQLNQVFLALLLNAAQAIEQHGRITVRTGRERDEVWVEVEDTGCGIPAENLGRIFDPFFTTKPVGAGTGLGLSLAYAIVQRHHGRIDVRSTPGEGTVVRVTLPQRMFTPAPRDTALAA